MELPLEVRVNGEPLAVVMRTPGRDHDLALGFLFTEGLLRRRAEIARVDEEPGASIVNVTFARAHGDRVAAFLADRRMTAATSACGLCGRPNLASLRLEAQRVPAGWSVCSSVVSALPGELAAAQAAFAETGGLHAAGLFDRQGRLEASAEDVGRHNAVDKLLGRMLDAGRLPLSDALLLVSGRASFEILQKAWRGGVPLVAAVSAPSSLAIELAEQAGITLVGFLRGSRFNIYSHASRITAVPASTPDEAGAGQ